MSLDARKNFAISTVATAPSPATSGTSLVVQAGAGANFPAAPFNAVIWPTGANPTNANAEIVRVTAKSTDTFTITRTQESTSARTVIVGDQIMQAVTSKTLTDIEDYLTGVASPTLLTPTIASFANANHNHQNSAGGGTLAEAALALTDITTNNASSTKHGFLPKLANVAGQFIDALGAWRALIWSDLPDGSLAQVPVVTSISAVATGTTTIPVDDTIPQITEGDEYMTATITPKATTNILVIECLMMLANNAGSPYLVAALFQDSTASALAASVEQSTASSPVMLALRYKMVAGTTSATTFRIRAGGNVAGTTTLNGQVGGRFFGAITKSTLVIKEYKSA